MTDSNCEDEDDLEINLRQRVRLFNLSEDGSKWCERGIGQVSACYFQKVDETYLLVNAESDGSLLLRSKIQLDTAYMKQQGRFIIWTEDDHILGLSFQENGGCDDVWKIICQVQGKDPYVEIVPNIKKEEIKEEPEAITIKENQVSIKEEQVTIKEEQVTIKEEHIQQSENVDETADDVAREMWFEEMLDIEHVALSTYERDVLKQLIELVNRLVSPVPEDKVPPPAESRLLDLFHISEDIEETEGLQQLHETILYLLSLNRDRQI